MRNIETISSAMLLLEELKRQNRSFSLSDFYLNKSSLIRGAVQIITPNNSVSCYADKCHEAVVKKIFGLLYEDFHGFKTDVWQEECCARGNVLFQFCSNDCSLAWFPTKLTSFQLKKVNFNRVMIDEINKNLSKRSVFVETNILSDNGEMLDLDCAMSKIKKMTF